MSPAHRKIKLLSVKLSSLTAEVNVAREIFNSAAKEVDSIYRDKYFKSPPTLEEPKQEQKEPEQQNKQVAQPQEKINPESGHQPKKGPTPEEISKKKIELDKSKDPEVKKLFKKIASKIHPDKTSSLKGKDKKEKDELFKKAVAAMEEDDLVILADVALELNLDIPIVPEAKIKLTQQKINDIKKELHMIESTLVWKWYFSEDEEKKQNTLERLLKILYEKNSGT